MKKIIVVALITTLINLLIYYAFFSAGNVTAFGPPPGHSDSNCVDMNTKQVEVHEAQEYISNLNILVDSMLVFLNGQEKGDSMIGIMNQEGITPCFTVRAADLLMVLGLPPNTATTYNYARVYIGYDKTFKIYFVPVVNACFSPQDTITGNDAPFVGPEGISTVLDLNAPCPPTCPGVSVFHR